jgi:hypothetical protein
METKPFDYRIPRDDKRDGEPYVPITRVELNGVFAVSALLLSFASFIVVAQGAGDEPYTQYRRYDAIVQVGIGTALMVLWCCYAIAVVVLAKARKISSGWLWMLLWAATCLLYLSFSPRGYLEDIERFVVPAAANPSPATPAAPTAPSGTANVK